MGFVLYKNLVRLLSPPPSSSYDAAVVVQDNFQTLADAVDSLVAVQPVSGFSGYSGKSGFSGTSGYSGISAYSGFSGTSGRSGYSGNFGGGDIDISGHDLGYGYTKTYHVSRTLPINNGNYVAIGDVTLVNGAGVITIDIAITNASCSVAKHYIIPVQYNATNNVWMQAPALSDTGQSPSPNTNDFRLSVNVNNAVTSLQILSMSISASTTVYVTMTVASDGGQSFSPSTSTGSNTPVPIYPATLISQSGNMLTVWSDATTYGTFYVGSWAHIDGWSGSGLQLQFYDNFRIYDYDAGKELFKAQLGQLYFGASVRMQGKNLYMNTSSSVTGGGVIRMAGGSLNMCDGSNGGTGGNILMEGGQIVQCRPENLSAAPTSPAPGAGQMYYNTNTLTLNYYNGTSWVSGVSGYSGYSGVASSVTVQALTDASSIAWNMNAGVAATVTLGGNRTLANPSNVTAGGTYVLKVTQDGSGSRTLAYGGNFKWPGGVAPTLSTGIGAVDVFRFVSFDGTTLYGLISTNLS